MLTLPVCRSAQDGVAYSVVEVNGVHHVYASTVPRGGSTLREQARRALGAVASVLRGLDAAGPPLHLSVFLADVAHGSACRQVVRDFYGPDVPATSIIPQPPCEGTQVAVEVLALGKGREKVQVERKSDQLLVARQDGLTWVYADQAVPRTSAPGVYEKTICSYQHLLRLLPEGGARLDQVLRTWLYLGGIVDDDGPTQRYKELNRARAAVYENVPFLTGRLPQDHPRPVFPASTGIGTAGRGISISAVALATDQDDVVCVPLENPRQTSAFAYSPRYSQQSPKFSRGMAVVCGKDAILFISGTASITHSETRHPGDVVAQTHETLENIAALLSKENLARHGLEGHGTSLDGLAVGRVYVKRREDYPPVRAVCDRRLPGVPLTYVSADVCRDDLLVEVEGIAFSRCEGLVPVKRCAAGRTAEGKAAPRPRVKSLCPDTCPERFECPHAVLPGGCP